MFTNQKKYTRLLTISLVLISSSSIAQMSEEKSLTDGYEFSENSNECMCTDRRYTPVCWPKGQLIPRYPQNRAPGGGTSELEEVEDYLSIAFVYLNEAFPEITEEKYLGIISSFEGQFDLDKSTLNNITLVEPEQFEIEFIQGDIKTIKISEDFELLNPDDFSKNDMQRIRKEMKEQIKLIK